MLHTVNKSPFQSSSLQDYSRFVKSGDVLLLLEDGVYACTQGTSQAALLEEIMKTAEVYAIQADIKARALTKLIPGVQVTDYAGFVDLVEKHKIHSWL